MITLLWDKVTSQIESIINFIIPVYWPIIIEGDKNQLERTSGVLLNVLPLNKGTHYKAFAKTQFAIMQLLIVPL